MGKVVYKSHIKQKKIAIISLHIPDNSNDAEFIDVIAKAKYAQQLVDLVEMDKVYLFSNIKVFFDTKLRCKSAYFDEFSRKPVSKNPKNMNIFQIDWKKKQKMITQNYGLKDYRNLIVAGFIDKAPEQINDNLFKVNIRNTQNESITINIWNNKIPECLQENIHGKTILFRKVSVAKPYAGIQSLNNNGPIYITQLYTAPNTDDTESTNVGVAPLNNATG